MKITNWRAPYLPYDEIRIQATDFLNSYNSSDELPVPIEERVEFQLNIDIIPINSLRDAYHTDGFISTTTQTVEVTE